MGEKEGLKDLLTLETSLCKQEKVVKAFEDYTYIPAQPEVYRNVASLGMVTLSVTWVIFDVFAYVIGYPKVSLIASIFTVALIIFFIIMKVRGKKAYQNKIAEYEEYLEKYNLVKQLREPNERTRRILEKYYEKMNILPRYRNLNAVSAMYGYLESGMATGITGADGAYKIYDEEMRKGRIPEQSEAIINDITSLEQITEYCEEVNKLLDELESKGAVV
jgi:hypothetical protein